VTVVVVVAADGDASPPHAASVASAPKQAKKHLAALPCRALRPWSTTPVPPEREEPLRSGRAIPSRQRCQRTCSTIRASDGDGVQDSNERVDESSTLPPTQASGRRNSTNRTLRRERSFRPNRCPDATGRARHLTGPTAGRLDDGPTERRTKPLRSAPAAPPAGSDQVHVGPRGRPSPPRVATARFACRTRPARGSHPAGPGATPSTGPCDSGTGCRGYPNRRPRRAHPRQAGTASRGPRSTAPACPRDARERTD